MASSDEAASVFAATIHGSNVVSVTVQQCVESVGAPEVAASAVVSTDPVEVARVDDAPAASPQAPQVPPQLQCFIIGITHRPSQDVASVVATSSILVGLHDESCISSSEVCKFQDVGVQTDFDGEKLPEGFVPYTKHRFVVIFMHFLLLHFVFLYFHLTQLQRRIGALHARRDPWS